MVKAVYDGDIREYLSPLYPYSSMDLYFWNCSIQNSSNRACLTSLSSLTRLYWPARMDHIFARFFSRAMCDCGTAVLYRIGRLGTQPFWFFFCWPRRWSELFRVCVHEACGSEAVAVAVAVSGLTISQKSSPSRRNSIAAVIITGQVGV